MHGTSHFIGLDVHDVGFFAEPMAVGNAFTVEPGIYIPNEGFGIRLENDILITPTGHIDLTESIPLEVAEIEFIVDVPDQPIGKVQLYVTPPTLLTEYVFVVPEQIVVVPLTDG